MGEPPPRPGLRAVVAEDEGLLRLETADLLTDAGYAVAEARDAAQAWAAIEGLGGVDLLFTDIRMPGDRDGIALAHAVAERWPDTRIVVCSTLPPRMVGALPVGARFLGRPYTRQQVRRVLL